MIAYIDLQSLWVNASHSSVFGYVLHMQVYLVMCALVQQVQVYVVLESTYLRQCAAHASVFGKC